MWVVWIVALLSVPYLGLIYLLGGMGDGSGPRGPEPDFLFNRHVSGTVVNLFHPILILPYIGILGLLLIVYWCGLTPKRAAILLFPAAVNMHVLALVSIDIFRSGIGFGFVIETLLWLVVTVGGIIAERGLIRGTLWLLALPPAMVGLGNVSTLFYTGASTLLSVETLAILLGPAAGCIIGEALLADLRHADAKRAGSAAGDGPLAPAKIIWLCIGLFNGIMLAASAYECAFNGIMGSVVPRLAGAPLSMIVPGSDLLAAPIVWATIGYCMAPGSSREGLLALLIFQLLSAAFLLTAHIHGSTGFWTDLPLTAKSHPAAFSRGAFFYLAGLSAAWISVFSLPSAAALARSRA